MSSKRCKNCGDKAPYSPQEPSESPGIVDIEASGAALKFAQEALAALREAQEQERAKLKAAWDHLETCRRVEAANEQALLTVVDNYKAFADKAEAENKALKEEIERLRPQLVFRGGLR